jgi:diaminopimelate decarboxylase
MLERKPYEPPLLTPLTFTAVSKHLTADVAAAAEFDESYDPAALLREFGSPLFVISENTLRGLFRNFRDTFSEPGIDTTIAYSYKTNYLPAVCAILHEEGAWAEVVSGMEYELARSLQAPPEQTIFNGPYKTRAELQAAFADGALVNIDNFDELAAIEALAGTLGQPCRVGIRVNFRYGPAPWTKFGFNDENGDAQKALERIAAHPGLRLELLHNHCGTFQLDYDIYAKGVEVLIGLARRARDLGLAPTMIDMGGGYPSSNRLKPMYDLPEVGRRRSDALYPYAEAILGPLSKAKELFGGRPRLVLEPGRALVDSAVQLLCSVVATKDIPEKGRAVVADGGVNLVPTAYWYDHGIKPPPEARSEDDAEGRTAQPVSIYGPLCMQIDVLREQVMMPPLEIGDPLVISNVGAYCQTQSMQFIQPRPATVLVGPEGPEVVQRRETAKDIFIRDLVPNRLLPDGWKL